MNMKTKMRNGYRSLFIEKLKCFLIKKHSRKVSSLRNLFLNRETCFAGDRAG